MHKILLVEDDPLMSRMYTRVLTLEGYEVETAENGAEGFQKAKDIQPDLILLDVMMPVMNGLQVLERLKADSTTKDIVVIMLTNLTNQLDEKLALAGGAYKYLVKSDHDIKEIPYFVQKALELKTE